MIYSGAKNFHKKSSQVRKKFSVLYRVHEFFPGVPNSVVFSWIFFSLNFFFDFFSHDFQVKTQWVIQTSRLSNQIELKCWFSNAWENSVGMRKSARVWIILYIVIKALQFLETDAKFGTVLQLWWSLPGIWLEKNRNNPENEWKFSLTSHICEKNDHNHENGFQIFNFAVNSYIICLVTHDSSLWTLKFG